MKIAERNVEFAFKMKFRSTERRCVWGTLRWTLLPTSDHTGAKKRTCFAPLYTKNDHFTKTDSEQT